MFIYFSNIQGLAISKTNKLTKYFNFVELSTNISRYTK